MVQVVNATPKHAQVPRCKEPVDELALEMHPNASLVLPTAVPVSATRELQAAAW